jgi:L-aspartate oxidase
MWENAGIVRTGGGGGLEAAAARLEVLHATVLAAPQSAAPRPEGIELRNLVEVARLNVRAARFRRESRGLHYHVDHPCRDNETFVRGTLTALPQPRRRPS